MIVTLTIAAALGGCSSLTAAGPVRAPRGGQKIEYETVSEFSRIRVRSQAGVRALIFLRDNGDEAEQSLVNVKKPYELLEPYSRSMFLSYLFQPQPVQVLIIGLGGGAMVHFLKHYDPQVRVDAVEIDPAVVKIADEYFECRTGGNLNIITADGIKYLETTEARYDVIYLDAFLKPTSDTDVAGAPLRMKTQEFYKMMQSKLRPAGVVVFNLNLHKTTDADLAAVRNAFARVYVFRTATANYVAIGTLTAAREPAATLRGRAREADNRFKASFSFQEMLKHLRE
jgi:spermidine synthase